MFSSFLILEALKKKTNNAISGLDRLPCFQEEIGSISWRKTMYLFQAENKIENSHDMLCYRMSRDQNMCPWRACTLGATGHGFFPLAVQFIIMCQKLIGQRELSSRRK